MKIKYCCRNLKKGTKEVYRRMKSEYPHIKHKKKDCLGCCKSCHKQSVACLGKSQKMICAASADELYRELVKRLG